MTEPTNTPADDGTADTATVSPADENLDGFPELPASEGIQISIDSPTARAPEHVKLPARYRDTEANSLADDRNWSKHLENNWGF
jgi:hypothetical protein